MSVSVCPNCQTPNRPGARFCRGCGLALAAPAIYQPVQPAATPAVRLQGSRSLRRWILFGLVGVLVTGCLLAAVGISAFVLMDQKKGSAGSSTVEDISSSSNGDEGSNTGDNQDGDPAGLDPSIGQVPTLPQVNIPGFDIPMPHLSDEDEVLIGEESVTEIEGMYPVSTDRRSLARVEELGQAVAAYSPRQSIKYVFKVLDTEEINAFALPGGFIYVTTGMLDYVESDDELAGVIADEVAHVALRHSAQQIEALTAAQIAIEYTLGQDPDLEQVYQDQSAQLATQMVASLGLTGWGREAELDADEYGTIYMSQAGFDPEAVLDLFHRLEKIEPDTSNDPMAQLLATHPPFGERIARVKQSIEKHHLK